MKIFTAEPGTSFPGGKTTFSVEKPISGLAFFIEHPDTAASSAVATTLKENYGNILVTSYFVSKNGNNTPVMQNVPLSALFDYTQNGEGVVRLSRYTVSPFRTKETHAFIQLCPVGALVFDNDESLIFELEGLPVEAAFKLTIYGLETALADMSVIQWNALPIPAGQSTKEFGITGYSELVIPVTTGALKEVVVTYTNGKTCRYTEKELQIIAMQSNDFAVVGDIFNPGYSAWYVFPVQNAQTVEFLTDGTVFVAYGVGSKVVARPAAVVNINARLVDTTEVKEQQEVKAAARA